MRTTEDLRAAFHDIADAATPRPAAAPDRRGALPSAPTSHPTPAPGWRATALVAAAVLAVGATAALVPLLGQHPAAAPARTNPSSENTRPTGTSTTPPETTRREPPPLSTALVSPRSGGPNLTIGFRVAPVAGFHTPAVNQVTDRFQAAEVDEIADWQQGNATGAITGPSGTVYVFYRGVFDPTAAEKGTPVPVHGKPGYFASIPYLDDGATRDVDSLVWQYAPDAWAVVQLEYPGGAQSTRPAERAVADAVLEARTTLKVPVALDHLPTGLALTALNSTLPGNGISVEQGATISHIADTGAALFLDGHRTASRSGGDSLYHALEITYLVDPTGRADQACGPSMATRTVDGIRLCLHSSPNGTDGITAWLAHASLNLSLARNYVGVYTVGQLEALIVHARRATDPLNAATWFDATTPR